MKRTLSLTLFCLLSIVLLFGQAPNAINYQGVARDNAGNPLVNQAISLKLSVHQGSAAGPITFAETFSLTTNSLGLFNVKIGTGTASTGSFAAVDWGSNSQYLEVALDPTGGTSFTALGTSQFVSVPYALYAEEVGSISEIDGDTTNELQVLSKSGNMVSLSNGGGSVVDDVDDADPDPNNEIQVLSKSGSTVSLSNGGGSFTDDVIDNDNDPLNEIQTLSQSGNTISLSGSGGSVNVPTSPWVSNATNSIYYNGKVGIRKTAADSTSLWVVQNSSLYTTAVFQMFGILPSQTLAACANFIRDGNTLGTGVGVSFRLGASTNIVEYGWVGGVIEGNTSASENGAVIFCTRDNGAHRQEKMRVSSDGDVGIGTANPTQKLHVVGSICYTTSIFNCSDRRYKRNIFDIPSALDKVLQMNGVHYDWRRDEFPEQEFSEGRQLGFIAQDLETIFPELVHTDEAGYKSVDYPKLTPILVEAVKEQQGTIVDLQEQNASLVNKLLEMESRLSALEGISSNSSSPSGQNVPHKTAKGGSLTPIGVTGN